MQVWQSAEEPKTSPEVDAPIAKILVLAVQFCKDHLKSFGGASERATPVPFPNTEVKPLSADGTWVETPWESRSPPDYACRVAP